MAQPPNKIDTLDEGALQEDLGNTYGVGLLLSNPELMLLAYQSQGFPDARIDKKTGKIIPGKNDGSSWDANTVSNKIVQSNWYATRDGNQRQAENAKNTDSASWNRRVDNLLATIREQANTVGADVSGISDEELRAFAEKGLTDNYGEIGANQAAKLPDRMVSAFLAPYVNADADGALKGNAQTTAASLRQKAKDYGVTFSDQWYAEAVQNLMTSKTTEADLNSQIINNSKSRYQSLASQINEGTSMKTLSDPYIQLYSQVMEQPSVNVGLDHPDIQSALQVTDPSTGAVRAKSLYEFQQDLRKKAEWGDTMAGRRELNAGAMSMLKDFGFVR
jgi:hypothetical protein